MLNQQWTADKEQVLSDDDMRSKMNIYSLIAETNYSKEWEKGELDVGIWTWNKWSNYNIRNMMSGYEPSQYFSGIIPIHLQ